MEIKVTIDEKELEELITLNLVKQVLNKYEYRYELKDAIGKGIKEHIYANKDQITEKVIERATKEIVKKGLPKFIEKLEVGD